MNLTRFVKLVRDCGLLETADGRPNTRFTVTDAELLFAQVGHRVIDFDEFQDVLNLAAAKLHPTLPAREARAAVKQAVADCPGPRHVATVRRCRVTHPCCRCRWVLEPQP